MAKVAWTRFARQRLRRRWVGKLSEKERVTVKRQDVIALLDVMPEDVDSEELIYRILLLEKLKNADREIDEGNFITHEELVRQSEEWLR